MLLWWLEVDVCVVSVPLLNVPRLTDLEPEATGPAAEPGTSDTPPYCVFIVER